VTRTVSQLNMDLEKNRGRRDANSISGLAIEETKVGSGVVACRGDSVTVRYSGTLNRGQVFQADVTATFTLGKREVIAGLERGVEGMKIGGIRKLRVSPHLAYQDAGVPGVVPPNAVLLFEVELLSIG
jgi:FKBP-type peptidyl-prolyl cis-trans isomerase